MTRHIESFQFPMNSSCTPYNQSDFATDVTQLCQDENDLLQLSPNATHNTNPFSLATSASGAKNRLRVAKCIVVGDISVGKTTLINRFVNDVYSDNYKATIGVDFEVQKFDILGRPFTLQIWDTAGQSRFRDITRIYYRGAHAVIVCFDLGNFSSFLNVKFWLNEVLEQPSTPTGVQPGSDPDRPFIFLIGTKKDVITSPENEARLFGEACELAEQIQAEFWMISSASGDNVSELFHRIACLTFNRYMANVAELARQELEQQHKSQSVFYTSNGDGRVSLPDSPKKKSKDKKKKQDKASDEKGQANQPNQHDENGNTNSKSKRALSRKALVRAVHVPTEMLSKFISNLSDQMHSMMKLKKKSKKSNKVRDFSGDQPNGAFGGTPDSGVQDMTGPKKTKKKTFRCFNIRCTFTVEK